MPKQQPTSSQPNDYEAEVADGLETIARDEMTAAFKKQVHIQSVDAGVVRFRYLGDAKNLLALKTVISVYNRQIYTVPRPKALLGHQYFHRLLNQIEAARQLHPHDSYKTLTINAAGSRSSVMMRLKDELAAHTGLIVNHETGDLLIRLRRALEHDNAWEALVRLSPRPLATRDWRVANMEGALNASVAHAMMHILKPQPDSCLLNIACGSGTLLIEHLQFMPTAHNHGVDNDPHALNQARANIAAAGYNDNVHLLQADARHLPYSDAYFTHLCADLPFGQLVGSHTENETLYPAILDEAARIAAPDAQFTLITHEIRLMERLLQDNQHWQHNQTYRVTLSGLHPRIYLLTRTPD